MKKTVLILAAVLGFAVAASAQPKALGVRIGWGVDIAYQHSLTDADFLEFDLGLDGGYDADNFHVDGVYNFMIARPDWTSNGSWGFYGGPGASLAVWDNDDKDNVVYAGFVGNLGLEYTFDIPLQFFLDVRPRLMFGDGGVRSNGIFNFGFGICYSF